MVARFIYVKTATTITTIITSTKKFSVPLNVERFGSELLGDDRGIFEVFKEETRVALGLM